jgi:aryl-alcohol dehydrogenase-like predicted oxidoreductase
MKHRRMGRTGLKVSEICLGTMTFGVQCDQKTSFAILDKATALGVDFLDSADVYPIPIKLETVGRTEEILGKWLKGSRDRFVVATKCFFPMGEGPRERGNSRRHVLASIEGSLRRLQTDYVDLYQVHAFDPETPLEETLRALDDATRAGKIRYAGCSNFLAWEMAKAVGAADALGVPGFQCTQPRYNALHRDIELDLLPLCADRGVGVIVFNPLAGGLLTGKHAPGKPPAKGTRFSDELESSAEVYRKRYWHDEALAAVGELHAFFKKRDKSLAAAAIAWTLRRPELTAAIVGASRPAQLDVTLKAPELELAEDELAALDALWFGLPRQRPADGPVR